MRQSDADLCRRQGWQAGDLLQGTARSSAETGRPARVIIRITAVGQELVLAQRVAVNGRREYEAQSEMVFSFLGTAQDGWERIDRLPKLRESTLPGRARHPRGGRHRGEV